MENSREEYPGVTGFLSPDVGHRRLKGRAPTKLWRRETVCYKCVAMADLDIILVGLWSYRVLVDWVKSIFGWKNCKQSE
ncbi:sexual development transcription factor NsdD [Aspergillus luchuensis]|uniref:Sexual development transcription factor NsdD n=1 Tax=Aspergillus kawachii TaxID=1069201 RepID=A0A146FUW7_ASPKA|nr:sexual development transcription factor NsdD [Aspergillus luchuensis]